MPIIRKNVRVPGEIVWVAEQKETQTFEWARQSGHWYIVSDKFRLTMFDTSKSLDKLKKTDT